MNIPHPGTKRPELTEEYSEAYARRKKRREDKQKSPEATRVQARARGEAPAYVGAEQRYLGGQELSPMDYTQLGGPQAAQFSPEVLQAQKIAALLGAITEGIDPETFAQAARLAGGQEEEALPGGPLGAFLTALPEDARAEARVLIREGSGSAEKLAGMGGMHGVTDEIMTPFLQALTRKERATPSNPTGGFWGSPEVDPAIHRGFEKTVGPVGMISDIRNAIDYMSHGIPRRRFKAVTPPQLRK